MPKWVLPRTFLDGPVDKELLDKVLAQELQECSDSARFALDTGNVAEALAIWSAYQENGLAQASCHCDGEQQHIGSKYFGRCQRLLNTCI